MMKRYLKYALVAVTVALLIIVVFIYYMTPRIPISDTLETGLHGDYYHYVRLLNRSVEKDTSALKDFLEIDVYDGAVYDNHGWILVELLKKDGDKVFSGVLERLDSSQIAKLKNYIKAGIDNSNIDSNVSLIRNHPNTFKKLGFNDADIDEYSREY